MGWVKRQTRPIPSTGSRSATLEMNDYSKGYNSYLANDKFPVTSGGTNMFRLAQDARITTLGEYETRKGFDFHSSPAGQTQDQAITAVTGASDQSFSTVTRLAQSFTAGVTGRLSRLDINLKNDTAATGTVLVCLYSDVAGSPGALLATSSIAASEITATYSYIPVRFASAPAVTATTNYWIVCYVQAVGTKSYKWSGTTSATTAKLSIDSGASWTATTYALNFRQYYATAGGSKGLFRATKSDGSKVTLFAHGTVLYSVNEVSGALTVIKSGLSPSATLYRFWVVNDIVYYVNGFDGYRKWDFVTESQVNTTNYTDLIVHKGVMCLIRADNPTRFEFSNFGEYEKFTSTDFWDVPAPKTGDGIAAWASMNGYLLIRTRNRCFIFSGDDNATFSLNDAPDQKGTYGPGTMVSDKNYVYFLSNDGVYRSNGSQPELMSENIYEEIRSLPEKDKACIAISKGRLYLWYRSPGSSFNDSCYVWNLNMTAGSETIESIDTSAYVSHAVSSYQDNDELLVASSLIGQVYWQEKASNDYANLGGLLQFELRTHYMTFSSPAVLKQIRTWQPRFRAQTGSYSVACDYAYDQRNNWQTYSTPAVQGSGPVWGDSSTTWGAFTWGSTAEVQASLYVPGEYRRIALRYRHTAARQPQSFLGHTLVVQQRRIR